MFFTSLSSITVLNEELNGNAIYKCGYEVKRTGGQMASTSRRAEAKADKEDTKLTAKSGVLGKSIHSTDMELRRWIRESRIQTDTMAKNFRNANENFSDLRVCVRLRLLTRDDPFQDAGFFFISAKSKRPTAYKELFSKFPEMEYLEEYNVLK